MIKIDLNNQARSLVAAAKIVVEVAHEQAAPKAVNDAVIALVKAAKEIAPDNPVIGAIDPQPKDPSARNLVWSEVLAIAALVEQV